MVECPNCKKLFKPRKRSKNEKRPNQIFCSRSCYFDFKRTFNAGTKITATCAKCDKQFKRWPSQIHEINYCSKSCANSANHPANKPRRYEPAIPKTCKQCGATFYVFPYRQNTAKFCSKDCWYDFKRIRPKARDNGLRNLPNKCMVCGFDIVVAVHHIIPRREQGTDDLSNLVILCPNHHAMADRGLISREELTALTDAAIAQLVPK